MMRLSEDELQGWNRIKAGIGVLLPEPSGADLYVSATAFVAAASSIPPPSKVGLGYWGNSVRLIWPTCEAEVFVGSFETYRFEPGRTRIETWAFHVGDALDEDAVAALLP